MVVRVAISRQVIFELSSNAEAFNLFGSYDENLALLEDALDVKLVARGNSITVSGPSDKVSDAQKVLEHLVGRARTGHKVTAQDVRYAVRSVREGNVLKDYNDVIIVTHRGKTIGPRTPGQAICRCHQAQPAGIRLGPPYRQDLPGSGHGSGCVQASQWTGLSLQGRQLKQVKAGSSPRHTGKSEPIPETCV